jgi:hypothetical protein
MLVHRRRRRELVAFLMIEFVKRFWRRNKEDTMTKTKKIP